MSPMRRFLPLLYSLILFLAAACSPAAASPRPPTPTIKASTNPASLTSPPTLTPVFTLAAPTAQPTPTATTTNTPGAHTPPPSLTPVSITPTKSPPTATACSPELCTYAAQYFLQRPIQPPDNDRVDITYRFGSTQGGMREPHHGVEMLNAYGVPVLAAADGVVIVAGGDIDPTSARGDWPLTFYGPYSNFYGSLVVIEHRPPPGLFESLTYLPQPVFTLYGHLSQINVEVGQRVRAGKIIGGVGMAGIATGNHLHFEVRLGENNYKNVSNPELWLIPHKDEGGGQMGGLAGRVIDPRGADIAIEGGVVLQRLPEGPDGPKDLEFYGMAYQEKALIGQPPFREIFAFGDLPAGLYRVSFAYGGVKKFLVEVFPGQLTVAEFHLEQ